MLSTEKFLVSLLHLTAIGPTCENLRARGPRGRTTVTKPRDLEKVQAGTAIHFKLISGEAPDAGIHGLPAHWRTSREESVDSIIKIESSSLSIDKQVQDIRKYVTAAKKNLNEEVINLTKLIK